MHCVKKTSGWSQCRPKNEPAAPAIPVETPPPAPAPVGPRPTLYCFVVITPNTKEPGMVAAQFLLNVGIFACDGHAVISNVSAATLFAGSDAAVSGLKEHTHVVDDPMSPRLVHGHLANAPLFKKVWQKVIELQQYQKY